VIEQPFFTLTSALLEFVVGELRLDRSVDVRLA
jgi:hypothetical protein